MPCTPFTIPDGARGFIFTFQDVTDIKALYGANPDLVELSVKRSDVLALIRGGTREIPGLRIYQDTRVTVRT